MKTQKVVIVGGSRIPFARSFTSYREQTSQELMTAAIAGVVQKFKLQGKRVGDVALGAIMNNPNDWNLSRESLLGAGLDPRTPGFDVRRACGTGLEATIQIANKIALGQIECGIAGGVDSNSDIPVGLSRDFAKKFFQFGMAKTLKEKLPSLAHFRPADLKPTIPAVVEPRTKLSMGQHCERMAKEWKVSREEQDVFALASHQNAAKAWEEGFYSDLVVEFNGVKKDTFVRKDSSLEKMAKLKPAFDKSAAGTLTAGNSSPLTDGASAVFVASEEYAKKNNLPILCYFVDAQAAAVDFVKGEGLLMAPTLAVSELLARNEMSLQDFDLYEIHEAFAAQVLCTLKAWESAAYCKEKLGRSAPLGAIDRAKINVVGSSIALGHPFAATGARIVATLAKLLDQKGKGKGLISICTGGGMGVAAIFER